ncbi:MAG TPA: hypothetical protein VN579_09360, partial [Bryobacteraceae bacterium]|nr:hypothetical protein [Bryobacteraceae bacterium]
KHDVGLSPELPINHGGKTLAWPEKRWPSISRRVAVQTRLSAGIDRECTGWRRDEWLMAQHLFLGKFHDSGATCDSTATTIIPAD